VRFNLVLILPDKVFNSLNRHLFPLTNFNLKVGALVH